MAVIPAGSARYKQGALRNRRRLLFVVAVFIVIVIGLVAHSLYAKKSNGSAATGPLPAPSVSARQTADVSLVAGAVGQYAAATGALPARLSVDSGGLVLCGTVCDSTSFRVTGFSIYQPSNIKLVSYSSGLVVQNQNLIYLVSGARCNPNGGVGAVNPDPRAMVMLYATSNGSTTSPRCLVL